MICQDNIGKRVNVWAGTTYLGIGVLVGSVDVHYFINPDWSIESLSDAEVEPSIQLRAEMQDRGCVYVCSPNNPKIEMDDGSIKYGCQVWWGIAVA